MTGDRQIKTDMEALLLRPEFRRFLWRVIQMAGIFEPVANGADGRNLIDEGRRNLGLEILADAELGQPVAHPDQIPILTMIQVLREEAQEQPTEKPHAKRDRYDRHEPEDDEQP